MCGIAGIINISWSEEELRTRLNAMNDAQKRRGPDGEGVFCAPSLALGHRRLAIIDPECGAQPLYNEDRSLVLVANGEIYNAPELRQELERRQHRWSCNSDSEVIIHLYEEYGIEAFARLRGMFAFMLYDQPKHQLILMRDAFGKKPLFWTSLTTGGVAIASTINALKTLPEWSRQLEPEAISDFFHYQVINGEKTVFKSVKRLKPGTVAQISLNSEKALQPETIFTLPVRRFGHQPFAGTRQEAAVELRRLLAQAVKRRLYSDVPLGTFLSGGVDSALISLLAAQEAPRQIMAFTMRTGAQGYDETSEATATAEIINRLTGGKLQQHIFELDSFDSYQTMHDEALNFGEPYADASLAPTALLCQNAASYIKSGLTGDGADEFNGGYERYRALELCSNTVPEWSRVICRTLGRCFKSGEIRSKRDRIGRLLRALGESNPIKAYDSMLNKLPAQVEQELFASGLSPSILPLLSTLSGERPGEWATELDLKNYLVSDILVKLDVTSMNHALELRSPFLDEEVCNFSMSLPWEWKQSGIHRKILLKEAFAPELGEDLFRRPKRGFGIPVAELLRTQWQERAFVSITEYCRKNPEFCNYNYFEKLWQQHQHYNHDHSGVLFALLVWSWHDLKF